MRSSSTNQHKSSAVRRAASVLASLAVFALAPSIAHAEEPTPLTPAFKLGLQGGLGYWTEGSFVGTNTAIGQGLALGYSAGLRASFEIFDWLALDARGLLIHNQGTPLAGGGNMSTVAGYGAARLTWPLAHVQPYALVGGGMFHAGASGGGNSTLISTTVPAVVAGLGVKTPVGSGFEVGAEYAYAFLIGESLSSNDNIEGGDPSTLSFFVQYRLTP